MTNIQIQRVQISDAEELIEANKRSRTLHAPWTAPFTDMDGFDAWYAKTITGPNLGFVGRERNSGSVVGVVNISEIVWGAFRSGYLSYYGVAEFARKGFMTEAVDSVCRHAFEEIGLHRLEANIQPDNIASLSLVQRAGFHREGFSRDYLKIAGEWRDHERWARLAG